MHKGKADKCGETIWYIQYNTIQNTVILACTYVHIHYRLGSLKQLAFQVVDVEVGGPTSISQTPKNPTPQ